MSTSILLEREAGVGIITLNRPDRLNSFTVEMHLALAAAFAELEGDETCHVILLTGAGRGFSAGQDLTDRAVVAKASSTRDLGESLEKYYNPLVRRMRASAKPIIIAVNGVAAGAGANIALHGDIVLAARSAKFIQSFAKIGLMPDAGGTWTLTHLLGEARAKGLALTAEPLSAEKAAEWGLIWQVVEDGELMSEARKLAFQLASQPSAALAAIKQAIHLASSSTLDAQLDHEREGQRGLGSSSDYAEGVAAFLEKRAPKFKGKI